MWTAPESCNILISTDIQEFYEVTLLNTQKSSEQKLEEVNHMAEKWEKSVSIQNSELAHSACPVDEVSLWCGVSPAKSQTYPHLRIISVWLEPFEKEEVKQQGTEVEKVLPDSMNRQTIKLNPHV